MLPKTSVRGPHKLRDCTYELSVNRKAGQLLFASVVEHIIWVLNGLQWGILWA